MPERASLSDQSTARAYVHRIGECTTLREYVNEATHGPCWKCGGGEDTHRPEGPRDDRLRPERGGIDFVVALGLGMPVQWPREAPNGGEDHA